MKTPSVLSLLLALAPTLAFSHNLSVGQTTLPSALIPMAK